MYEEKKKDMFLNYIFILTYLLWEFVCRIIRNEDHCSAHHAACRAVTRRDWFFLSTPHTHDKYFFLHTFLYKCRTAYW